MYGYGTSKANVWGFLNRILQFGGKLVDEEGKKSHFHEPEAVKALAFLQDLIRYRVAFEGQGFDHQNDFKAQRVAIIESSIVSKVYMESGIKFDYGVAPLPREVERGVILSGSNINIFNNGDPEKIRGAWEFVKWFTSTEIGAEWSVRTTYLPVRTSSLTSSYFLEARKKDPNLAPTYVQLDFCHFEPRLTCWFEIRDLMADFLEESTLKMGSPSVYLNRMSEDIDAILRHATD